jgi:hypothetical protein
MTEFNNATSTTTAVGTDAMGVEDSSTLKLLLRSMPDEKGEQRTFEIPYAAAKLSELIVDATGDHDQEEEDEDGGDGTTNTATTTPMEIDISRVKGDCLEKVVAFLIHYHEEPMKPIPTPLGGGSFNEVRKSGVRSGQNDTIYLYICVYIYRRVVMLLYRNKTFVL